MSHDRVIRKSCDFMSNSPFDGHRQFGRRDIMIFVCDVTLQDHVIKGSCDFIDGDLLASRHPAKFGGHRHCCNGDILFLVNEVQNSRCFHFNRHFCLFLYRLKHMTYHIINSGPEHTH